MKHAELFLNNFLLLKHHHNNLNLFISSVNGKAGQLVIYSHHIHSCFIYRHTLFPKVFGKINKMCRLVRHLNIHGIMVYHGSHIRHVDCETTEKLKTA